MAAAVVHKEAEIIISLNDSVSMVDADMNVMRLAIEDSSETRDRITIYFSLTVVNILNNRKLNLYTITRAIQINSEVNY